MKMRSCLLLTVVGIQILCVPNCTFGADAKLQPDEARAIARDAYIYGFPLVDSYRIQYAYYVDRENPEYKGPWNQVHSIPRVYTPDDKAVQTPNSDTPYSMLGMDLRTEPLVLTVPAIPEDRYFSVQLIDAYTFNFAYLGSRTTGNGGGKSLVVGPGWRGEKPAGIDRVISAETELVLAAYRTQLFRPDDIDNVKKIQSGYKVEPLSQFLRQPAPPAAPQIHFIKPLTPETQKTSLEFFNVLNFVLQFCPVDPSEVELRNRFARLGVEGGKTFAPETLSPELRKAVQDGISDAWQAFDGVSRKMETGELTSGDVFGTRESLKNNYLYRMLAAVRGIYGNSKQEAMYPAYITDSDGEPLDGGRRYTLRFAPGELPPVHAFWSLTMYELPSSLLVANPIHRYLINSPMLPDLKKDSDGGLTLYLQHESPGGEKESNWLPAPRGPFFAAMRLYWPREAALSGEWKTPPLKRVE